MPGILQLFFVSLPLTVCLVAYFLIANALFPVRVGKTKAIIQNMPWRSFAVGLINFSFFFILAVILISISDKIDTEFIKGVVMLPGLLILGFLVIMLTFGLAGMVNHIGERIITEGSAWKQTVWGSLCLCLACALPFVGWFLLLPYVGFTGIGAFILGVFQREPKV